MRNIAHKLNADALRRSWEFAKSEYEAFSSEKAEQKRERNALFFVGHVQYAIRFARLSYFFEEPEKTVISILSSALPESITFLELGGTFSPTQLRTFIGTALLTEHSKMIRWFAELKRENYTHPEVEVSEAGYRLIEVYQAAILNRGPALKKTLKDLQEALAPERLIVNPKIEKDLYTPLSNLLSAIDQKDQASFDVAAQDQLRVWKKTYDRASERGNWDGILDLETLGIYRLAERINVRPFALNPYAPLELLNAGVTA